MSPNSLTNNQIIALISEFKIDAKIASFKPFGSGHINDTYRLINADSGGNDYLLQRINHHVFRDVPLLMNNLRNVTRHLRQKVGSDKNVLVIIDAKSGCPYFKDKDGNYWRVFYFLKGTKSYDQVETETQAFEGGKAFGNFVALLSDLDMGLVKDSIPNFHNIEYRLANLQKAIEAKTYRLKSVLPEIELIKSRSAKMSEILQLGKAGILPKRIVHNDTKFNNVLLDSEDKAQCVIDLDTVMPGFVAYDFGDSIRTIINTTAEDEAHTDKIGLNISLFKAYTKGYLQEAKGFLTEAEKDSLIKGVLLMPYIQAVRFLTDYLEGDVYFKIHSPEHNLQRTRAQLALIKKLEGNLQLLEQVINDTCDLLNHNAMLFLRILTSVLFVILLFTGFSYAQTSTQDSIIVPLGGNAWRTDKDTIGGNISNDGIVNWSNPKATFTTYVRFGKIGTFKLYLNLAKPVSNTVVTVSALGTNCLAIIHEGTYKNHYIGEWNLKDTGYVAFVIRGYTKIDTIIGNVSSIKLTGEVVSSKTNYVKNNDGDFFYWGRRGPSVHLGYAVPDGVNAEWFYNEVTVPKGNDVLGSYFMADGFGEGYFGMQVNSPTERHILFSVWSPFTTDDPKKIPEDQKIIMLKKGENVHTGEFGSEGSGGQSYMNYMWKAGNTYKFLMHAKPDDKGRTQYTAYFYAPELGKWQLIASFSRPKTDTYLKHLHSFLENFEPEQGTITREVHFNNEWICDSTGKWTELTKARFTGDNTAVKGYRMDYAGGIRDGSYYLKNCGFFNHYTPRNTFFERPAGGKQPDVDLNTIKGLK